MAKKLKNKIARLFNVLGKEKQAKLKFDFVFGKYKDYTMIPRETFNYNLLVCEQAKIIPGAIVECGVWRGGMMAGMVEVFGNNREYFLFDSFEGLPPVKDIDGDSARRWQEDKGSSNYYDNCKAEIEYAHKAMELSGAQNVRFIKGWFSETLPQYDKKIPIALLRLDCDWYDSVIDCLETLFPLVAKGGIIIIDDYFAWDGCSIAVHDYLSKYKLSNRLNTVERRLAYIIK